MGKHHYFDLICPKDVVPEVFLYSGETLKVQGMPTFFFFLAETFFSLATLPHKPYLFRFSICLAMNFKL